MTRMNAQRVARILRTALSELMTLGLAAATAAPVFGQAHGTSAFTGSMHTSRADHTATLLKNGQVLVAGGVHANGTTSNVLASAELYNPSTGKWTVTGSMSTTRVFHTATLLKNGEVLVTGGETTGNFRCIASAELYNPSTGRWRTTRSMMVARAIHGAVLLKNGEVLVAAGDNSNGLIAAAELYDPSTGTFTATGRMHYSRAAAQLTLLKNGEALIAGGGNPGDKASCTAELFSNGHWRLTSDLTGCPVLSSNAALLANGDVVIDEVFMAAGFPSQFYDPSTNVLGRDWGHIVQLGGAAGVAC